MWGQDAGSGGGSVEETPALGTVAQFEIDFGQSLIILSVLPQLNIYIDSIYLNSMLFLQEKNKKNKQVDI